MKEVPEKVKEIADALKRDNPDWSDEKKMRIAWSTYEKMGKGKQDCGCPVGKACGHVHEATFLAIYSGKKVEIEASSLWDAKKKAVKELKVPKSKQGLLSVMNKDAYDKGDYRYESEEILSAYQQYKQVNEGRFDAQTMALDMIRSYQGEKGISINQAGKLIMSDPQGSEAEFMMPIDSPNWFHVLRVGKDSFRIATGRHGRTSGTKILGTVKGYHVGKAYKLASDYMKKEGIFESEINEDGWSEARKMFEPMLKRAGVKWSNVHTAGGSGSRTLFAQWDKRGGGEGRLEYDPRRDAFRVGDSWKWIKAEDAMKQLKEGVAGNETFFGHRDDIKEFLRRNPEPTDAEVHDFAESLGLEPYELEREIYKFLSDLLKPEIAYTDQVDPSGKTRRWMSDEFKGNTGGVGIGRMAPFGESANIDLSPTTLGNVYNQVSEAEAGFDLTYIGDDNWKELMKMIGASQKPKVIKNTDLPWYIKGDKVYNYAFEWKGKGVTIWTANDPISGNYIDGRRGNDKGYASYIGITGSGSEVKRVAEFIKANGDYKDYNPREREFI